MEDNKNINEVEEAVAEVDSAHVNEDLLKEAVKEQFDKVRTQAMLLGAQVICKNILDKITVFDRTPGNKSNNDHKRLIKDIKKFCEIGLSRKVNLDSTTETVQN